MIIILRLLRTSFRPSKITGIHFSNPSFLSSVIIQKLFMSFVQTVKCFASNFFTLVILTCNACPGNFFLGVDLHFDHFSRTFLQGFCFDLSTTWKHPSLKKSSTNWLIRLLIMFKSQNVFDLGTKKN